MSNTAMTDGGSSADSTTTSTATDAADEAAKATRNAAREALIKRLETAMSNLSRAIAGLEKEKYSDLAKTNNWTGRVEKVYMGYEQKGAAAIQAAVGDAGDTNTAYAEKIAELQASMER